jgi:hypothetical protein
MSRRLTNLVFFTFLGVVVGGLIAPSCGTACTLLGYAIGGGIGLLISCLINCKTPPTVPHKNGPEIDPFVE